MTEAPAEDVAVKRPAAAEQLALLARAMVRRFNLLGFVTLLALIGVWEVAVATGLVTAQYIVAPSEIAGAMSDLIAEGQLQDAAVHTLTAILIGWSIALVAGVAIGTAFGLFATARRFGMATVDVLRSLPTIALVPPAVLIFGFSLDMEISVIVYASIWPILVNTAGGIMRVPRELHDVARTLGLPRLRTAATVVVPAATPAILVGARLGMAVAVILAVVAEMVGNPAGLGYEMVFAQQAIDPAGMFAYIVTIGLLGVVLNAALVGLSGILAPVTAARAQQERER